ncbi:MAG TPA: winged helix DNA-binding domain-containing protein [Mycobacteriales bacterium]|nr:winged helix DNA-binding domain-containing protein [Mycobacteriales bacterium]
MDVVGPADRVSAAGLPYDAEKAVLERRMAAQLLSGPQPSAVEAAVSHLLAVQGQDPRGFRLALRTRTTGTTAADVDAALTDRRSLVVSWLNRGTLHLVAAEDYWWLHPLTTPQLVTSNATRLAQEGVTPRQAERGVAVIYDEVARNGPRTRNELRAALDAAGVPTARQALVHVIVAASLRGDLVRGPMRGKEQCFVSAGAWLGGPRKRMSRAEALALLARRYLAGHGPATARDLAKWAGITLGDARAGLDAVADRLGENSEGLVDLADRTDAAGLPGPRLLGAFDPVLCGWASREFIVGAHTGLVTSNGLFRPFALVDGRAVATWGLEANRITIRLLEPVKPKALRRLEADAVDVLRYLGLPAADATICQPDSG